jgi:chemotaxis signal transduction protein
MTIATESRNSANTAANAQSFVLLHVGETRYALTADIVAELAPPVRLHSFPHTSPLVTGVIVRRGRIVPVYDAGPALAGKSFSAHRFYLVARRAFGAAQELSAIPVNGECELATGEVQPAQLDRHPCVCGTLQVGDESVDVLDFETLVSSLPLQREEEPAAAQGGVQPNAQGNSQRNVHPETQP